MSKNLLPRTLTGPCCPGKSCGSTDTTLRATKNLLTGQERWSYLRESNEDVYLSLHAESAEELLLALIDQQEYLKQNQYT